MKIDDIKNVKLKELFVQAKHASVTVECDAKDSLHDSKTDNELIVIWQSHLENLANEIEHYWSELEELKTETGQ